MKKLTRKQLIADITTALGRWVPPDKEPRPIGLSQSAMDVCVQHLRDRQTIGISRRYLEAIVRELEH